jgi:TIR domain
MPEFLPFDVFLSHSSKDKAVVRELAARLRSDGLRVWFDEWEIQPGDNIPLDFAILSIKSAVFFR